MFDKLLKATVGIALLPIDVTRDVVTGDILEPESATERRLKDIGENLDNVTK